jgi:hypothetical protein
LFGHLVRRIGACGYWHTIANHGARAHRRGWLRD